MTSSSANNGHLTARLVCICKTAAPTCRLTIRGDTVTIKLNWMPASNSILRILVGPLALGAICLPLLAEWARSGNISWRPTLSSVALNSLPTSSGLSLIMRIFGAWDLVRGLLLAALVTPPSSAGTIDLPSFPLAVKSPYLSTWVPGDQVTSNAATAQPQFWTGTALTWPVLARVGSTTYALFGDAGHKSGYSPAETKSVTYTSTHTYITVTAGSVSFTLDFFTPVIPGKDQYQQQSLPYSYLTVNATTKDSTCPTVYVLSGIDQTWTAQNGASQLNFTTAGSAGFFCFNNPEAIPFTEDGDMATYGSVLFGTELKSGVSHTCKSASKVYSQFSSSGSLTASKSCSGSDLAAIAKNLGDVYKTAGASVTFIVGFDRVQAINYLGNTQTGYYRSKWPSVESAVQHVLQSYSSTLSQSLSFDSLIRSKSQGVSNAYGSEYADIVEASVRQTFATMELTVRLGEKILHKTFLTQITRYPSQT